MTARTPAHATAPAAAGIPAPPSPRPLIELGTSFWASKTLLTAVEIGLFTGLAEGPVTEDALRERYALHARGARDFLDALVALGVLDRDAGGSYRNAPATDLYLDENKPSYLGGWMRQASRRLFHAWSGLTDSLRSGTPHIGWNSQDYFNRLYENPRELLGFIAAMDAITNHLGPELAALLDWRAHKQVVDVGGARGNLLAHLLPAHPHLEGAVFDLPDLKPLFEAHMAQHGLGDRTRFATGDFFADPMPAADVVVLGHILHDWDAGQRRELLRRAYEALRPGGMVVVYDRMIDDARRENATGLLGSLNLLLVTPGGSEYTAAECQEWAAQAGFASSETLRLVDGLETAVVAHKAG
ncbi:methyltransferase [Streptomyces armeniacus]|uniref:Methyltransferase n=1 Tax=Streptomyces armeniacus TaxID=83291 RepID=A0A345XLM8_9ACTN|nr:methyltransferase [Streptomyces armeniacus]AXK32544.1 methyltransferase [Streptomyces armeniacus]